MWMNFNFIFAIFHSKLCDSRHIACGMTLSRDTNREEEKRASKLRRERPTLSTTSADNLTWIQNPSFNTLNISESTRRQAGSKKKTKRREKNARTLWRCFNVALLLHHESKLFQFDVVIWVKQLEEKINPATTTARREKTRIEEERPLLLCISWQVQRKKKRINIDNFRVKFWSVFELRKYWIWQVK